MFDLSFAQIVVIAVVLLVVVGPERLPGVARTAGHLLGRMQRYISDVKADIRREMQVDELKKLQQQTRDLEQSMREGMEGFQSDVQEALSLPESETAAPLQESSAAEGADAGAQNVAQEPQSGLDPKTPVPAAPIPAKPLDSV